MSLSESTLRKKAHSQGLRLRKARTASHGPNGFADYQLIDFDTGLPVWNGFDSLPEVEAWLHESATG